MERFLRREDVCAITALSARNIYYLMERGDFPRPIKVGPRVKAWRESAVEKWMREKIAEAEKG